MVNHWFTEVSDILERLEEVRDQYYEENKPQTLTFSFIWELAAFDEAIGKIRDLLYILQPKEEESE